MAYLGKGTKSIDHATISTHTMTGDGSDTTMSIILGTTSVNNVSVFISGVQQRPGQDYTVTNDVITFTTAPANGCSVVAFVRKDTTKGTIADASVGLDIIKDGAVTDAKILGLSASKLTGALPALDGSALTGISAVTTSTVDPATDTNSTLGAVWVNKVSGNTFVCTGATTDANVWTNVGGGTGNIEPFQFQGTVSGYTFGSNVLNDSEIVDKFSLTSDGNATNVATLSVKRLDPAEACSSTHGYAAGGWDGGAHSNIIDKWNFASDGDATDVGDLTAARYYACGQSSSTHGYMTGGSGTTSGSRNDIDKWSTSTDANATVVGTLTVARHFTSGQSSETHGYTSSGNQGGGGNYRNIIDRFAFASDDNAEDHGDLISTKDQTAGQSSTTHGYVSGGYNNSGNYNTIEKFAFASNTTAADHGDLSDGVRYNFSGSSSTTHGYSCGGQLSNAGQTVNIIDKFLMASNANATDVGDLSTNKCQTGSTQN